MITYQREYVYPDNKGVPTLYSIGVGLGRTCRFSGHLKHWYPVLSHVLVVAAILPQEAALDGLMHDAQEACMGDVPTPWKTNAAKRREIVLQRRIYKALGMKWPVPEEIEDLVVIADRKALAAEANVLGHARAKEFWPTYDEYTAELTLAQLAVCRTYLEPEVSGPLFERMYNQYLDESHHYEGKLSSVGQGKVDS